MVRSTDTLIRKTCSQDSAEHPLTLLEGLANALNATRDRAYAGVSVQAGATSNPRAVEPAGSAAEVSSSIVTRQGESAAIAEVSIGSHVLLLKLAETVPGGAVSKVARADRDLLRKSTLPVWLTRSNTLPRRIGVALHPDAISDDHARLNRQLAGLARQLRDMTGATLHGITTWRTYGETLLRRRIAAEELARYCTETRERAESSARSALGKEDGADVGMQLHVVEGEPLIRIPEVVTERSIDLLIVGNLARCGLPGLVVGNTVERLLPRVRCSVLAVPAGPSADGKAAA